MGNPHIVFISSKKSKFGNHNFSKKKKFVANYKISLIFFRFIYFVINFSNDIFQMNSKNFFFEKKKFSSVFTLLQVYLL